MNGVLEGANARRIRVRIKTLLLSRGEYGTLLVHSHLLLERGQLLKMLQLQLLRLNLLKRDDIAELLLGSKRDGGRGTFWHGLANLLPGRDLLPAIHNLAQIGPIAMEEIVREDDLTQPRGVHLSKAPPLEPSRKALEFGLAKKL